MGDAHRLVTVVLTVANLDDAVHLYATGFGLDLHIDEHRGDDPWTSGRHAATSWTDGAFIHFALYETKDGAATMGAQVAASETSTKRTNGPSMRAQRSYTHRSLSLGEGRLATATSTATSSS